MRVLAYAHSFPPEHNAGGEYALHAILRELVGRGHEAKVMAMRNKRTTNFGGVSVLPFSPRDEDMEWADLVITHLDMTHHAMQAAKAAKKPLVHLVHNHRQLEWHKVTPEDAALVVFNSKWLAEKVDWPGEWTICRPHVAVDDYKTARGNRVTLINLNAEKGGRIFYQLARRMKGYEFLGVMGSYGDQIQRDMRNVKLLKNSPNIKRAYSETRILLMPSAYESWGRVAIEAGCSGIPTLVRETKGTREALASAGIYMKNIRDWKPWAREIERLSDPEEYRKASEKVRRRAKYLEGKTAEDIDNLIGRLEEIAH